jgi:hypothetical protein
MKKTSYCIVLFLVICNIISANQKTNQQENQSSSSNSAKHNCLNEEQRSQMKQAILSRTLCDAPQFSLSILWFSPHIKTENFVRQEKNIYKITSNFLYPGFRIDFKNRFNKEYVANIEYSWLYSWQNLYVYGYDLKGLIGFKPPSNFDGIASANLTSLYESLYFTFFSKNYNYGSWSIERFYSLEVDYIRATKCYDYFDLNDYHNTYKSRTWAFGPEFGFKVNKSLSLPCFFSSDFSNLYLKLSASFLIAGKELTIFNIGPITSDNDVYANLSAISAFHGRIGIDHSEKLFNTLWFFGAGYEINYFPSALMSITADNDDSYFNQGLYLKASFLF